MCRNIKRPNPSFQRVDINIEEKKNRKKTRKTRTKSTMQVHALLAVKHVNFLSEIYRLYFEPKYISNGILEKIKSKKKGEEKK